MRISYSARVLLILGAVAMSAARLSSQDSPGAPLLSLTIQVAEHKFDAIGDGVDAQIFLSDVSSGQTLVRPIRAGMRLPSGSWKWHAEGRGWTTLGAPFIAVASTSRPFALVGRGARSCSTSLVPNKAWTTVIAAEIFSPDWSVSYRVDLKQRARFEIAQGSYGLAYYGASGLLTLSDSGVCDGKSPILLSPPDPLPAGTESTLVRVQVPASLPGETRFDYALREVRTSGLPPILKPTFAVRSKEEVSAAFVRRKSRTVEFVASGKYIKSIRELLPELDRGVREISLRSYPRALLETDIEYRPARAHRRATLILSRCFDRQVDSMLLQRLLSKGACETVARQDLRAGTATHSFQGLDAGHYVLAARVDTEYLTSLDWAISPVIGPEEETKRIATPWSIHEMEIFGQLLQSDEAVPGVVRVSGLDESSDDSVDLHTDERLTYHWYFFGRPFRNDRGDFPWRPKAGVQSSRETAGPPSWTRVLGCLDDGSCFAVASEAYFVGAGKFDIVVPATPPISLVVVDAETGSPLADTKIVVTGRKKALAFKDGETKSLDAPGFFDAFATGDDGRVKFRPYPEDGLGAIVTRVGYVNQSLDVGQLLARGEQELEVRLSPKRGPDEGTVLRDEEGLLLGGARAIVLRDTDGTIGISCAARANERAILALPASCRVGDATAILFVHPRVGLTIVGASDVDGQPELSVQGRGAALVLRVIDSEGRAVTGRSIRLGVDDYVLPDEIMWLLRSELAMPDLATDERGELNLSFISGEGAWFVEVSGASDDVPPERHELKNVGTKKAVQVLSVGP